MAEKVGHMPKWAVTCSTNRIIILEDSMEKTQPNHPSPRADLEPFRYWVQKPISWVPEQALRALGEVASQDSGGSQAARSFLFWLAGEPDPTGFQGQGGLELRRTDSQLHQAAVEVFQWWIGPTASDEPLYKILRQLTEQAGGKR